MIPKIQSDDLPRQVARLEEIAKLAPERRRSILGYAIREIERAAKRIARSGGVFSVRSTGRLAASLRGRVESSTTAGLHVGVAYGVIQDQGGTTRPHEIRPRFKRALAFASRPGFAAMSLRVRLGSARRRGGDFIYHSGPIHFREGAAAKLAARGAITGMTVVRSVKHPGSRIPPTHYSWKAWLASREGIREKIAEIMLGRRAA